MAVKKKKNLAKKKVTKKKVTKKKVTKKKVTKKKVVKKKVTKKKVAKKVTKKKVAKKQIVKKKVVKKTPVKKKPATKALKKPSKVASDKIKKVSVKKTPQKKLKTSRKLELIQTELQQLLSREKEEALVLKDMEGRTYCAVEDCGFPSVVGEYCRLHYIGCWDNIINRNKILEKNLLEKLITELIGKYSEDVLDFLIQDLKQEKTFLSIMKSLLEDDEEIENEEELINS